MITPDRNEDNSIRAFTEKTDWWSAYLLQSNQKAATFVNLIEGDREVYDPDGKLWERLLNPAEDITITILGAGDAQVEISFIKYLAKERGSTDKIHVYAEDVSPQLRDKFFDNLTKLSLPAEMVKDYQLIPLEDPNYKLPDKADIVFGAHMMYYVPGWYKGNPEDSNNPLRKIHESIRQQNGVAFLVMQSDFSQIYHLRSAYREKNPAVSATAGSTQDKELSVEDLIVELKRIGIRLARMRVFSDLDLSPLVKLDPDFLKTDEGQLAEAERVKKVNELLSFILRTDYSGLSQEMKQYVFDKINEGLDYNDANWQEPVNPNIKHGYWMSQVDEIVIFRGGETKVRDLVGFWDIVNKAMYGKLGPPERK